MKNSVVINFIGGPGAGKTIMAASLFIELKIRGLSVEYVQEVAKTLVWTKQFDEINNQHALSHKQYKILDMINGHVDYIITDGPLLNGLYYNQYNTHNVCDIKKTKQFIIDCHNKFININIYIKKGNFKYETVGRMQTENEAKIIEKKLEIMLQQNNIPYKSYIANTNNIVDIANYVTMQTKNN